MNRKLVKQLKENKIGLAPIDQETVEIIEKLASATGANAISIIHEAVKLLEKSLGRQLIVRKPGSKWDMKINKFIQFKTITDFEPKS